MKVLITGITGYIGSRLTPRMLRDGHMVRGLSRHPSRLDLPGVELIEGDAITGSGLPRALEGIDTAFYLIHSMEPSSNGAFGALERRAATNFARAAEAAGTDRIVYLGGLIPAGGPASPHLASRLEVERILLEATPCAVALRASIVIGFGSAPFRFLVRLVERLPVLALPAWHTHRTNPIDERDMIEILARAAVSDEVCGRHLDAAGPETVTYADLIDRIRDELLLGRPTISFRRLMLTPIASRVAAVIAGEHHELVGPLMESLGEDLLPCGDSAAEVLGVKLHSLDSAIERALGEWERTEPLAAR
jgi:uncharacterized protein YbjT (DUF2867 family)